MLAANPSAAMWIASLESIDTGLTKRSCFVTDQSGNMSKNDSGREAAGSPRLPIPEVKLLSVSVSPRVTIGPRDKHAEPRHEP